MAGFDDIMKSTQLVQNIKNSLRLSSQISEMLKPNIFNELNSIATLTNYFQQEKKVMQNCSGISMLSEVAKNLQMPQMGNDSLMLVSHIIKGSISFYSKSKIPLTTIESIISINKQHQHFYEGIRSLIDATQVQSTVINQVNNLNYALGGISRQIATLAIDQRNWTIIDDFEEVTEKALNFTETLVENETTIEERQRQFQVLISLASAFLKKHKSLGISALLIIDILIRFADLHQYSDFLKDKPKVATISDVNQISTKQDSVLQYIQLINKQLKEADEYRNTNVICEVKLKPRSKALTLTKLPKGFEVIILQVHHKWVLISYFDPIDELPQIGWVMKKYLVNPK